MSSLPRLVERAFRLADPGQRWHRPRMGEEIVVRQTRWIVQLAHAISYSAIAWAATLVTLPAYAESGVPPCRGAFVTEVFTGDVECDDARYLLVELGEPYLEGVNDYLLIALGGEDHANTTYLDVTEMLPRDAGVGSKLLIGTASVEAVFGITPDIVVESFPLEPHAGYIGVCFNDLGYHAADGQHMCAGDALRRVGNTWVNSTPAPQNLRGQLADGFRCGADGSSGTDDRLDAGNSLIGLPDAGADAATDQAPLPWDSGADRCAPSVFEPRPSPETSASTNDSSSGTRPPQSMSGSDAAREQSSDGASSISPHSSADAATAAVSTSTGTELVDAGSVARPAIPASDGCGCRVGRGADSPIPASTLALLAAALGFARRRSSSPRRKFSEALAH